MAGVYELHRSLQPEEIEKLQAGLQAELARGLAHGSVGGDELEAQSEPTTQMSSRHSGPTTQLSSRRAALKVEAVADFESVLTPVHGLPTRIELAGLGDVDEIRCSWHGRVRPHCTPGASPLRAPDALLPLCAPRAGARFPVGGDGVRASGVCAVAAA